VEQVVAGTDGMPRALGIRVKSVGPTGQKGWDGKKGKAGEPIKGLKRQSGGRAEKGKLRATIKHQV